MEVERIEIDPRIRYNYSVYYLQGINSLFPGKLKYDIRPFKCLPFKTIMDYSHGIPLVFHLKGGDKFNCFIDFVDTSAVMADRYEWSQLYCKVNVKQSDIGFYNKLFVIGPSFGMREDNIFNTFSLLLCNLSKSWGYSTVPKKVYLRDYLYTILRRETLSKYEEKVETDDNYIFHASTLWYDTRTDATTNSYRGDFLMCAKELDVKIEGGLYYIDSPGVIAEFPQYVDYLEKYSDFLYKKRLSMNQYISATKKSFVVFNTPSVCSCHGWKLAEYLCMGKAIISTPLSREMPGEGLVHGKSVHFVSTKEEIKDAILKIRSDAEYRHQLEKGARDYYEKYLSPEVVAKRIVDRIDKVTRGYS